MFKIIVLVAVLFILFRFAYSVYSLIKNIRIIRMDSRDQRQAGFFYDMPREKNISEKVRIVEEKKESDERKF
ncbi:MAG TPA: hypothetical protein PK453_19640 [Leptospiraceae bacterium]|nr:hypothetical protein [Leptospiraceae bacterium]HMY67243.1 hypothetical protein [Leptospiraceae bacterium]HNF15885.1 hypothetical protein [Leptospiraceae bacterium]HNI96487.1 hypothetical protein [Leptospiraceae bacterium]HNM06864.1 hypothetical protein [Leptospiraceae bacterium]